MYRDISDLCPRCGVPLVKAGAARGCQGCRGVWLPIAEVRDMASQMQIPPAPVELAGSVEARRPLACPDCSEAMETLNVVSVSIDVCKRRHGIWFDANELGVLLYRIAKPPAA